MAEKRGRKPFVIDEKILAKVERLAAQGLTVEQIARVLGISPGTYYEKVKEYPELSETVKAGRAKGVEAISNALFDKAMSGDNTAMIFYLKNRANKSWSDHPSENEASAEPKKIEVTIVDPNAK